MIRWKTYWRQTDGGKYLDVDYESGGKEQTEANARKGGKKNSEMQPDYKNGGGR